MSGRRRRPPFAWPLAAAWCVLLLSLATAAGAHDSRPLSITVNEQPGQQYRVRVLIPPTVAADNQPRLIWPDRCNALDERFGDGPLAATRTLRLSCQGGIEGEVIRVDYPIYNPSLATLFRLSRLDGTIVTHVLPPDQAGWRVPSRSSAAQVAKDYLKLGFDHIWSGLDHLLFVAGLMILAGSLRRVLVAVTGFTVAHSITLSLSALGLIHVPIPPVEAMIALSILFLAREIARPTPDGLARRFPILVSSSFGLLHGLGFAAALGEIGLPRSETAVGLLFFNVGVEIGQILFIGAASASFLALRAALRAMPPIPLPRAIETTTLAGYALGIPAAWWFLGRVAAFG